MEMDSAIDYEKTIDIEEKVVTLEARPPGNAVQVVRLSETSQDNDKSARELRLNTQVLRDIVSKTGDHDVAVIAIAGPARRGKSFMMSYIVRYLQALERSANGDPGDWMDKSNPNKAMTDKGFAFRNGMDRTTDGIWMWTRPFVIKRSESEPPIAVLVMDTEGCFDPYSNKKEQCSIVGLSLILSSCFVFNDAGLINESTLGTLATFMQYGQIVSESFDGKMFQQLMFLIRDWTTSGFEYGAAGGQGFILKCLASNPRMSEQAKVNRKLIQDNFEDFNAYLMPYPGKKVVSEEFTGSIGEMKEEFRNHVEKFVSHLIADVVPKRFGNVLATGRTVFESFCKFTEAFNAEDMPAPASILEVTIYIALDERIRKLVHDYEEEFWEKLRSKRDPFHSLETLAKYHRRFVNNAQKNFHSKRRMGSVVDPMSFAKKLSQALELKFTEISEENRRKQHEFWKQHEKTSIKKIETFIQQNIVNVSICWDQLDYEGKVAPGEEEIIQELETTLKDRTEKFRKQQTYILKAKLNKTVKRYWDILQEKKIMAEEDARMIINRIQSDYLSSMNIITSQGLLSDRRLLAFHEIFLKECLSEAFSRLSTQFSDEVFIQKFQTKLAGYIKEDFEKILEDTQKKTGHLTSCWNENISRIVDAFKVMATKEMEESLSPDYQSVPNSLNNAYKCGFQDFVAGCILDVQLAVDYNKLLSNQLESALQEVKDSVAEAQERKRKECEEIIEATLETLVQSMKSLSEENPMQSPYFQTELFETEQELRSKCEKHVLNICPKDVSYFQIRFDALLEERKEELRKLNDDKAQQLDDRVLDKIKELGRIYNQIMKNQEQNWTTLEDAATAHLNLVSRLYKRLQSEPPLSLHRSFMGKYRVSFETEIQKYTEVLITNFETQLSQKDQVVQKLFPKWIAGFEAQIRVYQDSHPFSEDAEMYHKLETLADELRTQVQKYLSHELSLSTLMETEAMETFREELVKAKVELLKHGSNARDATHKKIQSIVQACQDFASNHVLLHPDSEGDSVDNIMTKKIIISDVRSYYDDKWDFPLPSSSQAKERIWDQILDEITAKVHIHLEEQDENYRLFAELKKESQAVHEEHLTPVPVSPVLSSEHGEASLGSADANHRVENSNVPENPGPKTGSHTIFTFNAVPSTETAKPYLNKSVALRHKVDQKSKMGERQPDGGVQRNDPNPATKHLTRGSPEDNIQFLETELLALRHKLLLDQSLEEFRPEISQLISIPSSFSFANIHSSTEKIFAMLKSSAIGWEKLFKEYNCLPDLEMNIRLEGYKSELRGQISSVLPENIQSVLLRLVEKYAGGYKQRNTKIQVMQAAAIETLIKKAVDYYCEEMKIMLEGKHFIDFEVLQAHHDQIYTNTQQRFLNDAALKHTIWKEKYLKSLDEKIKHEKIFYIKLNKKSLLEFKLPKILEECVKCYKTTLEEEKWKCQFNPNASKALEIFSDVGGASSRQAMKNFEEKVSTTLGNQNEAVIQNRKEQLQKQQDHIFKEKRQELIETQQKQDEEIAMQKPAASRKTSYIKRASSTLELELAIHFGLHRTTAGIHLPGTEEFKLLADLENVSYFKYDQLLLHQGHVDSRRGASIEDLISRLFTALKSKAELEQSAKFPGCVICVPQFLNRIQVQAVKDGAALAGFYAIKTVTDTNAIALAYILENRILDTHIITVNASEGFAAAYFNVERGIITRKAGTDKNFPPSELESGPSSWLSLISHRAAEDSFLGVIKDTLRFRLEKGNKKGIQSDSSQLAIAIVGIGECASKEALEAVTTFGQVDWVDQTFPVKGAAYLAQLQKCHPEDPICKHWLDAHPLEDLRCLMLLVMSSRHFLP